MVQLVRHLGAMLRQRRLALGIASALSCGGLSWPSPASSQPSLEQAVKASYLFKFAPFVEWPPRAFEANGSRFVICLAGPDPFGKLIDELVQGQRISGHPVSVRRLGDGTSVEGCHMLFARHPDTLQSALIADAERLPILTVSDHSAGNGGMIRFMMQGGRVRFAIDEGRARANGLRISSKLLDMAVRVDRVEKQ